MNTTFSLCARFLELFHHRIRQTNDMLSLIMFEYLQSGASEIFGKEKHVSENEELEGNTWTCHERVHNIGMGDSRLVRNVINANVLAWHAQKQFHNSFCPVCTIAE